MSFEMATLTLQEAADRLGVHYMTAYRYVRHGRLAAHKEGKSWVVDEDDLVAFESTDPPARGEAPWGERIESRMLAGDVAGAAGVVNEALASGVEPAEIYTEMIMPAMRRIGDRWSDGDLDISDEHRASMIAQRLVGQLGHRFARRGRSKGTVVVCSAPGEAHWLGAMMVGDLIRGAGFDVLDMGPDMPLESLQNGIGAATDVVAVALASSVSGRTQQLHDAIEAIRTVVDAPIVVGGAGVTSAEEAAQLGADGYVGPGDDPVAVIQDLVG